MEQASPISRYREDNEKMTLEQFGKLFTPPVDKSTVLRWERGQITPGRAIEVEIVSGISRHDLRPDIFGPAPENTASSTSEAARAGEAA